MPKTIERWLLFRHIRGEFTPLSKPFKTKQLAEEARSRYPERERKAIGIAETGKQELICPSLLLMPIDLSYPGCYHTRKDKTLAEPPFPQAQREHTLFSVIGETTHSPRPNIIPVENRYIFTHRKPG